MTGTVSVSYADLARRRHQLRRRKQIRNLQAVWRTVAITSLAGGLVWVATQPIWVVKNQQQVVIKSGDQVLSADTTKSLLNISYPKSLWEIQPRAIANSLERQPTILQANVTRSLFPPSLNIKLEPRVPVAVVEISGSRRQEPEAEEKQISVGLIDASGVSISLEQYKLFNPHPEMPSLKVIGAPERYRSYWSELYSALSQISLKVTVVDAQDPKNWILQTEVGNVHLGSPSSQLTEKINILGQMDSLSTKIDLNEIKYLDLHDPEFPVVHVHPKTK